MRHKQLIDCCEDVDMQDLDCCKDVDEALTKTGSCGRFQVILVVMLMIMQVAVGYQSIGHYYVGYNPPWRCSSDNATAFCQEHQGGTFDVKDGALYQHRCSMNRSDWIYTIPKNNTLITEFDLICDKTIINVFCNSAYFIGWGLGGIPLGILADRYGRKNVIFVCLLLFALSAEGSAFITDTWQYISLRVLLGVGYSGCGVNLFILANEFVNVKHRAIVSNLIGLGFSIATFLMTLVAYLERNWRLQSIYCGILSVASLSFVGFVPESIRWLQITQKSEAAEKICARVARINKKNDCKISLWRIPAHNTKAYSYIDLFRKWTTAKLVLVIAYLWFANGLTQFVLVFQASELGGDMYTNLSLMTLVGTVSTVLSVPCADRLGRRISTSMGLLVAGISCLVIAFIPDHDWVKYVKIALANTGMFFTSIAFTSVYIWSFELYPTVVRMQGMALCQLAARIGSILAPFVSDLLIEIYVPLPYIVMTGVSISAGLCALMLDETNKESTREHFNDFASKGERKKRNHIYDAEVNSRVNDADIVADEELANSENETVNLIT